MGPCVRRDDSEVGGLRRSRRHAAVDDDRGFERSACEPEKHGDRAELARVNRQAERVPRR